MSQWDRPPPGSKRRSDFTDSGRPGSYQVSFPRHSHTSQSPEVSTSPHSYQEGQTPKTVRQSSFPTAGSASSSNVVGRRIDASFYASSSTMRRPNPLSTSATELTLPPIAHPSPTPARLTQGSGDLSPKFGADHLNTQALLCESNDLSAAYAQAQINIANLDTKVQASQAENGRLTKERQRLMGKIEVLEAQLEELERNIQQSQRHIAAKDAQYSRILELSTRLQSQGAEARKAEQYEWSCEKQNMQGVIDSLNNELNSLRKASGNYTSNSRFTNAMPSPIDDHSNELKDNEILVAESSTHKIRTKMEALKRTNARMEDALAGVRGDNAKLLEYIGKLGGVEKNIERGLQEAETAKRVLTTLTGKELGLAAKE